MYVFMHGLLVFRKSSKARSTRCSLRMRASSTSWSSPTRPSPTWANTPVTSMASLPRHSSKSKVNLFTKSCYIHIHINFYIHIYIYIYIYIHNLYVCICYIHVLKRQNIDMIMLNVRKYIYI